jgi:hypothetical protein
MAFSPAPLRTIRGHPGAWRIYHDFAPGQVTKNASHSKKRRSATDFPNPGSFSGNSRICSFKRAISKNRFASGKAAGRTVVGRIYVVRLWPKTFLLCSATGGVGCSFVAFNLYVSLSWRGYAAQVIELGGSSFTSIAFRRGSKGIEPPTWARECSAIDDALLPLGCDVRIFEYRGRDRDELNKLAQSAGVIVIPTGECDCIDRQIELANNLGDGDAEKVFFVPGLVSCPDNIEQLRSTLRRTSYKVSQSSLVRQPRVVSALRNGLAAVEVEDADISEPAEDLTDELASLLGCDVTV